MCRSHSSLVCMNSTLWNFNCLAGIQLAGLLIIFWWNLENHLPWPLLHQIGGPAVFTVLWVPLSYHVARPGFSDSHDLPGHGVQFSTGLSRSASLWSALISCYLPGTMCELSADYSDIAPSSRGRGHCSSAPLSPCPMLQPFSLSSPDLYSPPGAGPADL